jgi:hypothetical protein
MENPASEYNPLMQRAVHFYTRLQTARGRWDTLPPLARSIVGIFALPGIALLLLSIAAAVVSIFVLLLLTVPVYRVLQAVFGVRRPLTDAEVSEIPPAFSVFGQPFGSVDPAESPGRRQVDAKVTDAE